MMGFLKMAGAVALNGAVTAGIAYGVVVAVNRNWLGLGTFARKGA